VLRKATHWLLFLTITTTKDRKRARQSRFFWSWDQDHVCWRLRVIGVLNGYLRVFGVALAVNERDLVTNPG
jgi:hypothetical protein